jgi:multidrug efflux system membrane fusion protein
LKKIQAAPEGSMRLYPLLTAVFVIFALYLMVFERAALVAFASGDKVAEIEAEILASTLSADAVSVVAFKSVAQNVDSGVVLRGRTEAARNVTVRAETSGLVVSEPLPKGSAIEAGQLLCRLDPGTKAAKLAEAKARLAEAAVNNRAASRLAESGFGSETQAIARAAALEGAQAGVELAEKEIERLNITAPFAGHLVSDVAELGSLLQPGSECAQIVKLDPIRLVGFVPETEIDRLSEGALAGARLSNGTTVQGQVTYLALSADPQTRTFRVEVEVPNPNLKIREGGTADIFVSVAGEKAHLLPQSAMTLNDNGELGVRSVRDGRAAFVPVRIVRDTVDGVWLAGLPQEADVIIVGQEYVTEGRKVTVTYQE